MSETLGAADEAGTIVDPRDAAEQAGLLYVTDAKPGITRHAAGKGVKYRLPNGKPVTDAKTLARISKQAKFGASKATKVAEMRGFF